MHIVGCRSVVVDGKWLMGGPCGYSTLRDGPRSGNALLLVKYNRVCRWFWMYDVLRLVAAEVVAKYLYLPS